MQLISVKRVKVPVESFTIQLTPEELLTIIVALGGTSDEALRGDFQRFSSSFGEFTDRVKLAQLYPIYETAKKLLRDTL